MPTWPWSFFSIITKIRNHQLIGVLNPFPFALFSPIATMGLLGVSPSFPRVLCKATWRSFVELKSHLHVILKMTNMGYKKISQNIQSPQLYWAKLDHYKILWWLKLDSVEPCGVQVLWSLYRPYKASILWQICCSWIVIPWWQYNDCHIGCTR